jgi:hypothetical protein
MKGDTMFKKMDSQQWCGLAVLVTFGLAFFTLVGVIIVQNWPL